MVEDHLLEYENFEGIIPEGYYGSGAVVIWDNGYYLAVGNKRPEDQLKVGRIEFILHGKKLKGGFALIHLKGRKNQWLLIKKEESYADERWKIKLALTDEKKRKLKLKMP